jgi:signal transduction histidine kinase
MAVAVSSVTTVAMSAGDLGAYMEHTFNDLALSTQLYIAIAAFTALCLAAMVSERERDAAQLAESRAQAALAAAEERRRVEAELHDSAQNRLVTIALRLQLARYEVERTAPAIAATLSPLIADVDAVIGELRRIAHGTVPPLLRRQGLVAALRAECEHSAIAVHISRQGVSRSDPARELAMYLCCLEAVQNAAKHAGEDAAVRILLRDEDQRLSFTIEDTGCGFDPRTTTPGSGLANLRERIEGVGGRLEIASAPGRGTAIAGVVPWPPDPPASRDGARAAAKLS